MLYLGPSLINLLKIGFSGYNVWSKVEAMEFILQHLKVYDVYYNKNFYFLAKLKKNDKAQKANSLYYYITWVIIVLVIF